MAPDPGARGGIERATRLLVRALADLFGPDRVELAPVWGADALAQLPCRLTRDAPSRGDEGKRVGVGNKAAFILSTLLTALRSRERVLVIACHTSLAPVAWLCSVVANARYAVWCHGSEIWFRPPRAVRLSLRRAGVVFSGSRYTARRVETVAGLPNNSVRLVPYPVLPGEDEPIKAIASSDRYLLTVARLDSSERLKGIDTTIRALSEVQAAVPGIRYVIVGDGEDRPRLERVAIESGVADSVDFVGAVGEEEKIAWYRSCEVLVMPSRQEGFGLVYLEAALFGKPSIGGNHGGAPEAVLEGVTGYVVEFGDVVALTKRLVGLLTDDDLRRQLGDAARARVMERHSFDAFLDNIRALTHDLAAD